VGLRPLCGVAVVLFRFKASSNSIQFVSNFDRSKKDFRELENFETKYGCDSFEERNNFLHRNFSRFEMDFELNLDSFPNLNPRRLET
jgi:hypothetical protein